MREKQEKERRATSDDKKLFANPDHDNQKMYENLRQNRDGKTV